MSRFPVPATRDDAPEASHALLDGVAAQLGFVPNLHRLLAMSPAVLSAVVGLQTPLTRTLDAKTRHGISLAVSEVNGCDYCLSAHTFAAANAGRVTPEEIALNRQGRAGDPERDAAVGFARKVVETRGKVSEEDLAAVREAGFTDAQILEIVALAAQFLLTNFMNNVADTDIDFPAVERARAA
jgi:uncharacterized peroxidase-related enzyme